MSNPLVQPVVTLMLLTMLVWLYMYYLRISYTLKNKINAQRLASPEECTALLPDFINQPSNNLKNLFEAPIIFYVICLLIIVTKQVDIIFVYSAWAYVFCRIVHSVIHCTFNNVMARFYAYFISSAIMWFMLCKFAYTFL